MRRRVAIAVVLAAMAAAWAAADKVPLRVWDSFTEEAQSQGMDSLVAAFGARFPGVEVKREAQSIDDMRPVLQTALASGTGPDVMYYDCGPGFAGVLARAGLLLPLDAAYKSYGWDKRIYPWTRERASFDGKSYGIANELEFVWVYYNKAIFKKLGVAEPKTYKDFTAICEKAKKAGYTPISFADKDKWPAFHQFSLFANNIAGKKKIWDTVAGKVSWKDPDYVRAVQLFFVDLCKAGYFIQDSASVSYDDGNALFYSGQAAMHMTGTWLISGMTTNVKDFEVGAFFFPSIDGKPVYPPAGVGSGYFVSAKTAHAKEATDFLDHLFSAGSGKVWMQDMQLTPPIAVDAASLSLAPLLKTAAAAIRTKDMGYNIDVLTSAGFNTAMADGFQAVMLGLKSPQQQIDDMEKAFTEGK
jgi:raffinose/stachyose/melibiose transport system substrate-binding protein